MINLTILKFRWRLPYRPITFKTNESQEFELSIAFPSELVSIIRNINHDIGSNSNYSGDYWLKKYNEWVVGGSNFATFEDLIERLLSLYVKRHQNQNLISQYDMVNYFIAFVHQFRYVTDKSSAGVGEYARFPIETLHDQVGDCDCLSVLLAALLIRSETARVSLIRVKKSAMFTHDLWHIAVGVVNDWDSSIYGKYFIHAGERYYYCEATSSGWTAGQMPDTYKSGSKFWVYPISNNLQLDLKNIYSQYEKWDYCALKNCKCNLPKVCTSKKCKCNRPKVCTIKKCECELTKMCNSLSCNCGLPKVKV